VSSKYNIYTSSLANKQEFGTAFFVDSDFKQLYIYCSIAANLRFKIKRQILQLLPQHTIMHAPTTDSEEEAQDQFYEQLERAYSACPKNDVNLMMGYANAKVVREIVYRKNGLRMIDFAAGRQMAIKSTYLFMHKLIHLETWHSLDGCTRNQIVHCFIDGQHFSGVNDVRALKGENIDSDQMLVVIKLRYRISRACCTNPQQLRRFAVDRVTDGGVAQRYHLELEAELNGGYTRKQTRNEWRLNDVRRPFEAQVAICRAKDGELLTNKDQVLLR
jgi:hypothetical protein